MVEIRSVLTCESKKGVCMKCYGRNLATSRMVQKGEAVGVIAAQSIGEPGTQLTLRTFHTGGVAQEDIVQGLPRVEELFEARKPKNLGFLAEISGVVTLGEEKGQQKVTITRRRADGSVEDEFDMLVPHNARLNVTEGDTVVAGDVIVDGFMNPHDILRIKGLEHVQRYIVDQVQTVYRDQGVDISDKHVEVIVRQMLRKVRITDAGDTNMLPGSLQDVLYVESQNNMVRAENDKLIAEFGEAGAADKLRAFATFEPVLLGVTKASLATDSFLSAASFQETTKVLTEAAINGKVDHLRGLKENVIIGKLIPAGTGMEQYRQVKIGLHGAKVYEETKHEEPSVFDSSLAPEDSLAVSLGSSPFNF